jgi:hypothetical protein
VGGVISGMLSMGSSGIAMVPTRTMTMEMTSARTGR